MRVIVCLKQVIDPLTPASSLVLDQQVRKVRAGGNAPPVINGFDEQGLEAALRLRQAHPGLEIVGLALGERFNNDVMKRALAVGADQLVLVQDPSLDTPDSWRVAAALAAAIRHLGGADLVICGRQGSDWDNALVPVILADALDLPLLTLAKTVSVADGRVEIERVLADGSQMLSAALPALVTVTSELGPLRNPTVAARLQAARRQPRQLAFAELGAITPSGPAPEVIELTLPAIGRTCTFIEAADGGGAGSRLAETLIDAGVVRLGGERAS